MPNLNQFSEAYEEALANSNHNTVIIDTIELKHDTFDSSLYLVRGDIELKAKLGKDQEEVTFIPYPFDINFSNAKETSKISLSIPNIDNQDHYSNFKLIDSISIASQSVSNIKVLYRPYLSGEPLPQMDTIPTFYIFSVEVDEMMVKAECGLWNVINHQFPTKEYTEEEYPNLFHHK